MIFFPGKDNEGRARAIQVQLENRFGMSFGRALALVVSAGFLAALALSASLGRIEPVFPIVYALMSTIALGAYSWDKTSARRGARRISENALHLLELSGGWPGALVAQHWLRHKNRKLSYQLLFWVIVAAHLGSWIFLGRGKR